MGFEKFNRLIRIDLKKALISSCKTVFCFIANDAAPFKNSNLGFSPAKVQYFLESLNAYGFVDRYPTRRHAFSSSALVTDGLPSPETEKPPES
jgi:hypothetical protein